MNKFIKHEYGITLIALLITIIIIIIMAGVSIRTIYNTGMTDIALRGSQNYLEAQKNENIILKNAENEIEQRLNLFKSERTIEYSFEDWLLTAGIEGTYTSLSEITSDTEKMNKLFNDETSVDYMVNAKGEIMELVLNSEEAVKSIAKSDLARKKVLEDETWRNELYSSENKNAFFENINYSIKEGTTTASLEQNNAASVFSGGYWPHSTSNLLTAGNYIQYTFKEKSNVYRIDFIFWAGAGDYQAGSASVKFVAKLVGSNDGENFEDIINPINIDAPTTNHKEISDYNVYDILSTKKYQIYKFELVSGGYSASYLKYSGAINAGIENVRLYAY